MTQDEVTTQAIRLIQRELEAIGFDLDSNLRQIAGATERRVELETRRRDLIKLLRMHGGDPAQYQPEAVSA